MSNDPADVNQLLAALSDNDVLREERNACRAEAEYWKQKATAVSWRVNLSIAVLFVGLAVALLLLWRVVTNVERRADERQTTNVASICLQARDHLTVEAAAAFFEGAPPPEVVAQLAEDRAAVLWVSVADPKEVIRCEPSRVLVSTRQPPDGS